MAPSSHNTSIQPTGTTTSQTDSTATHHNPDALAAATAAATAVASRNTTTHEPVHPTADRTLPSTQSTSAPLGAGAVHGQSSHQHIPGEFPTPTPGDESNTFLEYRPDPEVAPGTASSATTSGLPSHTTPSAPSGTDVTTGQHELRHTGSLDQPTSRSADVPSEHHYGRDAALAGGLAAGAAGVGHHLASEKRGTTAADSKPLYEETSPYSSKAVDPRVMGTHAPVAAQTVDPHHAVQTSNPAGITTATDPTSTHVPTETHDSQHHLGRDAALIGGGAATASALRPTTQRNDTPGTGTFILPQESSTAATHQPSSSTTAPLAASAVPVSQPHSTERDITEQPSSGLGHTSGSTATQPLTSSSNVHQKDSEHHLGRDAALVGGGAATAAGLSSASHDHNKTETGPASKTIGPHDSNIANILDPRVQPEPSLQKDQTTTGPHKSDLLNKLDPKVDNKAEKREEHHYGRDAALVGGTGAAAGLGAHEISKSHQEHRSTQPETVTGDRSGSVIEPITGLPMNVGKYGTGTGGTDGSRAIGSHTTSTTDPVGHSAGHGVGAGLGAATAGAATYEGVKHAENKRDLPSHQTYDTAMTGQPGGVSTTTGHHGDHSTGHGVGAGLGAATAGAATYEGVKHAEHKHDLPSHQTHDTAMTSQPAGVPATTSHHADHSTGHGVGTGLGAATAGAATYEGVKHAEHRHDLPTQQTHGTTMAGQPGMTQPGLSQDTTMPRATQEPTGHQRYDSIIDPSKQQHHDKRDAALLGATGAAVAGGAVHEHSQHEEAEQEKAAKKEQHKLEKEQHKHDKEVAAAQHKHEKETHKLQKEQHKHDKELAAEEKEAHHHEKEEGKKGGILGFLHRDKSKKDKTSPERSPHPAGEIAAAGAVAAEAAHYQHEKDDPNSSSWKGKTLLHKEPPVGHPAHGTMEHQGEGLGQREHIGVDGPIGQSHMSSGDR